MQDDGFIAKLLQESGAKDLAVGTPLAILVEEQEAVAQFSDYTPSGGDRQQEQASPPGVPCTHFGPDPS